MTTLTCRVCGKTKPVEEMKKGNGKPEKICRMCHNENSRRRQQGLDPLPKQGESKPGPVGMKLDPCPVCGVTQAKHWKCRQCGSRGHILGRGTLLLHLCGWCEEKALKAELREAA